MATRTAQPRTGGKAFAQLNDRAVLSLAMLGQYAMRMLRDALNEHGLKPRQFQLLDVLEDRGPIGQGELGDVLGIDHSVLVTFLNPLEADGHISRDRDPQDRRRHVVSITPTGLTLLHAATTAQRDAEQALLAGLTDAQRTQLTKLLARIQENTAGAETDHDCEP